MITLDETFAKMFLGMVSVCHSEGIDGSNEDPSWDQQALQQRFVEILLQIKEKFPKLAEQFKYLY